MSENMMIYVMLFAFPFIGTLLCYLLDRFVGYLKWLVQEWREFHEYERAKEYWLDYDTSPAEFLESKYGQ